MKKITKIALGLAALDVADIMAKGQMLYIIKNVDTETHDKIIKVQDTDGLRLKMIMKVSDVFEWLHNK